MIEQPQTTESNETAAPSPTTTNKPPPTKSSRQVRRFGTQSTTLEALDDSLGPLGPLGDNAAPMVEEPPAPPQKERLAVQQGRPGSTASGGSSLRGMMESVDLEGDGEERNGRPRIPPPVQPPSSDAPRRQTQPSVSIEQAAKPTFDIAVGDPHKVGDLTSSHTVYQVRTKVSALNRISWNTRLTEQDYFKSIPQSRVYCISTLQRLPLALRPASQQQSWRRCPSTSRKASCRPL